MVCLTKVLNLQDDIANSLEFSKWKDSIPKNSTFFIEPDFPFSFYKEGITKNLHGLKEILEIINDKEKELSPTIWMGITNSFIKYLIFEWFQRIKFIGNKKNQPGGFEW
jgi:hypothetical protein